HSGPPGSTNPQGSYHQLHPGKLQAQGNADKSKELYEKSRRVMRKKSRRRWRGKLQSPYGLPPFSPSTGKSRHGGRNAEEQVGQMRVSNRSFGVQAKRTAKHLQIQ